MSIKTIGVIHGLAFSYTVIGLTVVNTVYQEQITEGASYVGNRISCKFEKHDRLLCLIVDAKL